jgi:hypothetical protein
MAPAVRRAERRVHDKTGLRIGTQRIMRNLGKGSFSGVDS